MSKVNDDEPIKSDRIEGFQFLRFIFIWIYTSVFSVCSVADISL